MRPPKALPALMGGLFIGVLSVLPIVREGNACCCLWVVIGGLLAAWVMQQNHPVPVSPSQGAAVGFLSGLIGFLVTVVAGAVVAAVYGSPLDGFSEAVMRQDGLPPAQREMLQQIGPAFLAGTIIAVTFAADLFFGTLGGLIGAALFRSRAPLPPEPAIPIAAVPSPYVPPSPEPPAVASPPPPLADEPPAPARDDMEPEVPRPPEGPPQPREREEP